MTENKIETKQVTGRVLVPWVKKINPWWWLWNDLDQIPDQWYMPGEGYWKRQFFWWWRNPFANFVGFVVGVNDRNYEITGTAPVEHATKWDTLEHGWHWSVIRLKYLRLPFVSYSGEWVLWYVGWRYSGGFGVKLNGGHKLPGA